METSQPWTMESSWTSRLVGPLEEQAWLDQAADYVLELAKPLLEMPQAGKVMDFLHGRWFGHPLHPVLTDVPIGFWTGSLLLDLVGAHKSAGVLSAAGSAGAAGAAVTGFADWSDSVGRDRRLGILHGLLNVSGLALQVLSLSARLRRRKGSAVLLSAAGLSVSTAAAYLGGELVYGRGVMVNRDAWISGPEKWTPVLPESHVAFIEGPLQWLFRKDDEGRAVHGVISAARDWLVSARRSSGPLAISVVSLTEIAGGMRSPERREVMRLLGSMHRFEVSEQVAWRAATLMREHRRSHSGIGLGDYLIAATALTEGLELATLNIRH